MTADRHYSFSVLGTARRSASAAGRALTRYAAWLGTLSWKRFALLAVLVVIATSILSELPPFTVPLTPDRTEVRPPRKPLPPTAQQGLEVTIGTDGVRVAPRPAPSTPAASVAAPGQATAPAPTAPPVPAPPAPVVDIKLPPEVTDADEIRRAIAEAKTEIRKALGDAQPRTVVIKGFRLGDHLVGFVMVLIVLSILAKVMMAGRQRAEARAAVATEMAESEALKRQVVEARMAAMQAQVEPHFLFNTLASIDHLIETDPARASRMQKNLIALLRASMPTMRETGASGAPRDLARELAVVKPYLEILKVRMEERLNVVLDVPDGLLSAEFPSMMMQSLVENAIKHGLEPKPEGGTLTVKAEIVHGKLAVTVADTGLGFGKAATAGTGVGLANIRERLQLLYGPKASLVIAENRPSGTVVTVTVPYVAHTADAA